jgi:hypothetical protein
MSDLDLLELLLLFFAFSLRTMHPRGLDSGVVRAELQRALDVWAQNSKLTFREVNDDRADILVFFEK